MSQPATTQHTSPLSPATSAERGDAPRHGLADLNFPSNFVQRDAQPRHEPYFRSAQIFTAAPQSASSGNSTAASHSLALVIVLLASLFGLVVVGYLFYRIGVLLRFELSYIKCKEIGKINDDVIVDLAEANGHQRPRQRQVASLGPIRLSRALLTPPASPNKTNSPTKAKKRSSLFAFPGSSSPTKSIRSSFAWRSVTSPISRPPQVHDPFKSHGPRIRTQPPALDPNTRHLYKIADVLVGAHPSCTPIDLRRTVNEMQPKSFRMVTEADRVGHVLFVLPRPLTARREKVGMRFSRMDPAPSPPPIIPASAPPSPSSTQVPTSAGCNSPLSVPLSQLASVLPRSTSLDIGVEPPTPSTTPSVATLSRKDTDSMTDAPSLSLFPLPPGSGDSEKRMTVWYPAPPLPPVALPISSIRSNTVNVFNANSPKSRSRSHTVSSSPSRIPRPLGHTSHSRSKSPLCNTILPSSSSASTVLRTSKSTTNTADTRVSTVQSYSAFKSLLLQTSPSFEFGATPPRKTATKGAKEGGRRSESMKFGAGVDKKAGGEGKRAPLAPKLAQHSRFPSVGKAGMPTASLTKTGSKVVGLGIYQEVEGGESRLPYADSESVTKRSGLVQGRGRNGKENYAVAPTSQTEIVGSRKTSGVVGKERSIVLYRNFGGQNTMERRKDIIVGAPF